MKYYRWISYLTAIALALGLLVTVGVLVAYGVKLGPISGKTEDWGAFGSILSGAFTLLGAAATLGTLVFLLVQQRNNQAYQREQERERQHAQAKHDDVIAQQLKAQTFEQYLKHREVFFDRLHSLEATFAHAVRFANKDALYQWVFPQNSPTRCSYVVDLEQNEGAVSGLVKLRSNYLELLHYLHLRPVVHLQGYLLITKMQHLMQELKISYQLEIMDGDLQSNGQHLGVNIYSPQECLEVITLTINSLLFYAGNAEFGSAQGALKETFLRRKFVVDSLDSRLSGDHLAVRKSIAGLVELERYYLEVLESEVICGSGYGRKLHAILDARLQSKQEVKKLEDYNLFNKVVEELKAEQGKIFLEYEGQEDKLISVGKLFSLIGAAWHVAYKAYQQKNRSR